MGRVSLTEDYDDRSVISKLNEMDKRVTENTTVVTSAEASAKASAAAAQETADRFAGSVGAVVQNANQQINASKAQVDQAKAEVDETVTTVAQAVQTANQASASAQQSATTVEGYDTRLTAVETKNSQQDTDISALQTADTNNVKLSADYQQNITGALVFNGADKIIVKDALNFGKSITIRHNDVELGQSPANVRYWNELIGLDKNGKTLWQIEYDHLNNGDANLALNLLKNDASTKSGITITKRSDVIIPQVTNLPLNAPSTAIVNKAYVESTDGVTNNLVHRTANEKVDGIKEFAYNTDKHVGTHIASNSGYWVKLVKWTSVSLRYNVVMTLLSPYFRDVNFYGKLMFGCWDMTNFNHLDLISPYNWANRFKVTYDGNEIALWYNNTSGEYKLGINVFIDIECNGTDKSSRAILIPESEQVAENPDWSSFTKVLDGTYKGWSV